MTSVLDTDLTNVQSFWIYVLRLEGRRYYVGKSYALEGRLAEHFAGKGADYTQQYKPVKCIYREQVTNPYAELQVFIAVAKRHGLQFVRGSAFCQTDDQKHINSVMTHSSVSKEFL